MSNADAIALWEIVDGELVRRANETEAWLQREVERDFTPIELEMLRAARMAGRYLNEVAA